MSNNSARRAQPEKVTSTAVFQRHTDLKREPGWLQKEEEEEQEEQVVKDLDQDQEWRQKMSRKRRSRNLQLRLQAGATEVNIFHRELHLVL